ncbi:MAG: YqgE/AlgH family protein [Minwuia sp.]|uniref:YqgE/AlgH family protein n=1 Tax=Minwuia sp. TaxID=2493630 RepID=UPI003A84EEAE
MSSDTKASRGGDSLEGQILIAMPTMADPRFERSVIYMCAHSSDGGAMGLIVNKSLNNLSFADLAGQLDLGRPEDMPLIPIHYGGPVETGRGFVLHSQDYGRDGTIPVGEGVCLTATVDILRAMAGNHGPEKAVLALGYAGWAPGQLEGEIQRNDWLHCDGDPGLLFDSSLDDKWTAAVARIGIDPALLSSEAGRA